MPLPEKMGGDAKKLNNYQDNLEISADRTVSIRGKLVFGM